MNASPKIVLTILILLLLLGSVIYAFSSKSSTETDQARHKSYPAVAGTSPEFGVYYFYNDIYCTTCERLEGYAYDALLNHYTDELEAGTLVWKSLDMTDPAQEQMVLDFALFSKSIVLVAFEEDSITRWENLKDIWDEVHDQEAYTNYIVTELEQFMEHPHE